MANLDYISHQVIVNVNGVPIPGAKINYYLTGTTTPQNTYSDAGLTAANTNPVICDANGCVPEVYLAATRYKRAVTDASNVSLPQYDVDPLDASQQIIALAALPSPAYPLLRVANTTDGHTYRRNLANSAWIDEGLTDSLLNAATVTDQLTGTSVAVASTPDSVAALWQRGTDIASAATLSLPATGGGVFNITGTTGISAISSAQGGRTVKLRFAGACVLTHNATSFILPGAVNRTTAAGDMMEFINDAAADASGSNWRCFNYETASGSSLNITDQIATQANQETGTDITKAVTPGRQQYHASALKAHGTVDNVPGTPTVGSSYNLTGITDNGAGDITWNWIVSFSSAIYSISGMCNQEVLGNCSSLMIFVRSATASTMLAASCRTSTGNASTGTETNTEINSVMAAGDQ